MTAYYADTSVLLKQHINEPGHRWFRELIAAPNASISTTELSMVEVYSAFNRLLREGRITTEMYGDLATILRSLFASRYESLPVTSKIRDLACSVLERHPLRAYDSVHLASALYINQELIRHGKPPLTFLSADHRLLAAAAAEGLATFDPSTVP